MQGSAEIDGGVQKRYTASKRKTKKLKKSALREDMEITNSKELEFAVFCIENIAIRINKNPTDVFRALTEKSDILMEYMIPSYDVLHTQGKDYIVGDILTLMKEKNVL